MTSRIVLLSTLVLGTSCRSTSEKQTEDNSSIDTSGTSEDAPNEVCTGEQTAINTSNGCVVGVEDSGLELFLGVPYAKPPLGDLRWQRPEPIEPWTETFVADSLGDACVQYDYYSDQLYGDEDCLTLNVIRPSNTDENASLPILFFTHGGSYVRGMGSYDIFNNLPTLANNAILVTHNYRLGIFGFLAHEEMTAEDASHYGGDGTSGNQGLFDTLAALKWVNENAQALGGDPNQIMIFGESAGGGVVCSLLASPLAANLFSSALIQSTACTTIVQPLSEGDYAAENQGASVAEDLNCNGENELDCLRAKSATDLLQIALQQETGIIGRGFSPNVDGLFVPDHSGLLFYSGEFNRVPVAAGVTSNEGSYFVHYLGLSDQNALSAQLEAWAPYMGITDTEELIQRYSVEAYGDPQAAADQLYGDAMFVCPTRLFLDYASSYVDTRAYFYNHEPYWLSYYPHLDGWGAYHSSELPYIFGQNIDNYPMTDRNLSLDMQALWIAFAKGEAEPADLNNWEIYGEGNTSYINGGNWLRIESNAMTMESGIKKDNCDFFYDQWFGQ